MFWDMPHELTEVQMLLTQQTLKPTFVKQRSQSGPFHSRVSPT